MSRARVAAALASFLVVTVAAAADRPPLRPAVEPEAEAVLPAIGAGWYLRVDAGAVAYGTVKDVPHGVGNTVLDRAELADNWSVGLGAGYRLASWLRVDVTADHRVGARFWGLSSASRYRDGYSHDTAEVESTTYLANAYLDLGTWYGLTPYLGAGVGLAHNTMHRYAGQKVYFARPDQPDPDPLPRGDHFNLAYALMAGVGVDMGYGIVLEGGYRYVNLGSARTGLDAYGIGTRIKDMEAHEARLGLRWSFQGSTAGPRPVRAYAAPLKAF